MPTPLNRTFASLVKGLSIVTILVVATAFRLPGKAEGVLYVADGTGTTTSTADIAYNSSTRATTIYKLSVGAGGVSGITFTDLTLTNATATNLYVSGLFSVGGQLACLADGTNCPAIAASTETLLSVTNRGAAATSTLALFGGATVGGTLTATGTTALQVLTFTNATGANLNLTGTGSFANISFTGATGTSLSLTGPVTFVSGTGTNLGITTLSTTNINIASSGAIKVGGGNASSTFFLSGASALIGSAAPIPTSTSLVVNGIPSQFYAFNASTTNCIYWTPGTLRGAWDAGVITPSITWTSATGSGAVVWRLRSQSEADNTYVGNPFSGIASFATTTHGNGYFRQRDAMDTLTVEGAAAGVGMRWELCRIGGSAGDTLGQDAYVEFIDGKYGISKYSD